MLAGKGEQMTTGDRIAQKRKENNLTQEELAYKLGVSRQAVSGWENGLNYPETEKLIAMSNYFGVTIDWLLNGGEEKKSKSVWKFSFPTYTSEKKVGSLPLFSLGKNAKGIIAVGLFARGLIAVGLLPIGLLAFGVLPIGLLVFGSFSFGLISIGGMAFGALAFGGVAVGILSFGGFSVGLGAIGGCTIGQFAYGGYANGTYLALGDTALGQIALGSSSATGSLFSYVGTDFSSVYEEISLILETTVPKELVWLKNIFLQLFCR